MISVILFANQDHPCKKKKKKKINSLEFLIYYFGYRQFWLIGYITSKPESTLKILCSSVSERCFNASLHMKTYSELRSL